MSRLHQILVLGTLVLAAAGCGGSGGGSGGPANANPGLYESAYTRGAGSVAVNIPTNGNITALVSDTDGNTYTGTLIGPLAGTGLKTPGTSQFSGTLTNTHNSSDTLSFFGNFGTSGSTTTINGSVSGAFSASFVALNEQESSGLKPPQIAGSYTGTATIEQGGTQVASADVTATVTSAGSFTGDLTDSTDSENAVSFDATISPGGGFVGTATEVVPALKTAMRSLLSRMSTPGSVATVEVFFGTIAKSSSTLVVSATVPGTSPSTDSVVSITLTKVSGSNQFTGSFKGSSFTALNTSIASDTLNVQSNGNFSGVSTGVFGGTPVTFSGNINTNGVVTGSSGTNTTISGLLHFNSANQLTGTLITTQGSQSAPVAVTLVKSGQPLQFVGSWSGPYAPVSGTGGSGVATTTVATNGSLTGQLSPTGGSPETYSGTVNSLGVLSLTDTDGTVSGGAAYDSQGNLIILFGSGTNIEGATLTPN